MNTTDIVVGCTIIGAVVGCFLVHDYYLKKRQNIISVLGKEVVIFTSTSINLLVYYGKLNTTDLSIKFNGKYVVQLDANCRHVHYDGKSYIEFQGMYIARRTDEDELKKYLMMEKTKNDLKHLDMENNTEVWVKRVFNSKSPTVLKGVLHIKDDGSLEIQCGDLNPLTLDKSKQRERVTFQDDDYSWFVTGTSIYVTLPSNHSTFEITAVNKDLKHLGLMDNTPVLMKKFVDGVMDPPEAVHGVFYIKDYGSFEVVSIKDGHRIVFEIDKKDQTDDITFKVGEKTWTITKTGISINAIYKPSDGKQQRQTIEITVNDKPTSAGNGRLRKTKRVRRR